MTTNTPIIDEERGLKILELNNIISGDYVFRWCKLPYDGHKSGCPMYGTRSDCPPEALPFDELVQPPYYLIIHEFDLEGQAECMRDLHPNWSDKQCRNPRYWQKGITKKLMAEAQDLLWTFPNGRILKRPEANGINLFATCRAHGIRLERNPQKVVRKMVLIGRKKED